MIKLGITGGIGSGKSTVSEIFSLCGVPVYIADIESKRITETSPVVRERLIELFGEELFANGYLNKPLLASYIFNDSANLQRVNAIIHPEVEKDFYQWAIEKENCDIVAQEAAILFESGFNKLMDSVVTVYAPLEIRVQRSILRDNVSREKIMERIRNQMPDEDKIELSDFVIVNDGTISLIEQVLEIIQQLNR